jgi:response regulator RpfG family c-di-GMP phosphodiesterase
LTRRPVPDLPRVLYADDDPRAVELFREQANRQFAVSTANSGAAALEILKQEGPFAVVVSDYQMLGMSGLTFLAKVKEVSPESTRLLITGHPDLTSAMGAVNDGFCFRFMTKPCTRVLMLRNLEAAVEQYNLVISQRVLLEQTLEASIKALCDILALASPTAFGRSTRAREHVTALLEHSQTEAMGRPGFRGAPAADMPPKWEAEVAAMLSHIGCVSLPPETATKIYQGESLTAEEQTMADRLPALAEQLVAGIPRLEGVRAILRYQAKHFDGSGYPPDNVQAKRIPWGARALKIALDFDTLEAQGVDSQVALDTMKSRKLHYDPQILEAFAQLRGVQEQAEIIQELGLREVVAGMVFAEDVRTRTGQMLIARGTEVTPTLSERIRNMASSFVQEPVKVLVLRPQRVPAQARA